MKTNYVLIDYENVQVKSLGLLRQDHFRVKLFLGPHNTKLPVDLVLAMQELADRAEYIVLDTPGSNALDFHIAFYLGQLALTDPAGFFHIISKDTGFDPLLKHLKAKKVFSSRSASIEEMPCFAPAAAPENLAVTPSPRLPLALDDYIQLATGDLIKRKASKPRTQKTLLSTIHAKCGKEMPLNDAQAILDGMINRGYVKVVGEKVSYALPAQA